MQTPTGIRKLIPYEKTLSTSAAQKELHLFGASRVGMVRVDPAGDKYVYELSDHLGNVRTTFERSSISSVTTNFDGKAAYDYLFSYNTLLDTHRDISGSVGTSVVTAPGQQG